MPTFKTGDHSNLNTGRPISILPVFSKVFERNVHNQLQSYLDHSELLDLSHLGLRPLLSICRAGSYTFQYFYNNLDNGSVIMWLFLYFAKAFDCVDLENLLEKLSSYGIMGAALIWSDLF